MVPLNKDRLTRKVAAATGFSKHRGFSKDFFPTCLYGPYLKGIAFERRGVRDSLYAWAVILPWFHPRPSLTLNFSKRINDGVTLNGSEEEIAQQAIDCILTTPGLRDSLAIPTRPAQFLADHKGMLIYPDHTPISVIFDLAVTAILAEDYVIAAELFAGLESRTGPPALDKVAAYVDDIQNALRTRADIDPILARIAAENPKF